MKKILPIIAVGCLSALLVGCDKMLVQNKEVEKNNNLNEFEQSFKDYGNLATNYSNKVAHNKYQLAFAVPEINEDSNNDQSDISNPVTEKNSDDNMENINEKNNIAVLPNLNLDTPIVNNLSESAETVQDLNDIPDSDTNTQQDEKSSETDQNTPNFDNVDKEKISTLYNLSTDIEDSCDEFCELKSNLTNAIIETQNLLNKVKTKEIELTNEQKMFVQEQSNQLKNLSRQLSRITTELNINLSDINSIFLNSDQDFDQLNMKYLIVLDNLINGNEMLESGLSSLNMIQTMFNSNSKLLPPNNQGRIFYGFKQNDDPVVIEDYYKNENGEWKKIEGQDADNSDTQTDQTDKDNESSSQESNSIFKKNIDSYNQSNLKTNIDSYGNRYNNIDTFFNTAWLDNGFMYGNNGGYGNMPYGQMGMNNFRNYPNNNYAENPNNTIYGEQNNQNTKDVENNNSNSERPKKLKFNKNIDTYRDENTPSLKTKFGNMKKNVSSIFSKFKHKGDKFQNPIYTENDQLEDNQ